MPPPSSIVIATAPWARRTIGATAGTGATPRFAPTSHSQRSLGRGLGKHLLSCAVRDAWALAPSRVWLHTCTLDHPAALPNYEKRGFARYKTETYEVNFPP